MQSSGWGESKSGSNWPVSRFVADISGKKQPVQIFSRTVPGLGRLHYSPELSGIDEADIPGLTKQLREQYGKRSLALKVELYQPYSEDLINAFKKSGWVQGNSVQHRSSVIADLSGTEDEMFARLKKRARYESRVGQRSGVKVEKVEINQENLDKLWSLMQATAQRSGAFFRKNEYNSRYWKSFNQAGQASLFLAWHEEDLLAGAFVIEYGKTAWYKDGGSVREKSNLMAPRYLQWEIMKDLHKRGFKHYDLSGIPAENERHTSSMKGLYTFKTGFSNETVQFMPAMELKFSKRYPLWPKAEHQFLRLYSGLRKDFWY